jgi:putative hemolysin
LEIFIILLLILVNAFFSLSEIALVSSKKIRLEHLREEHKQGTKRAFQLLNDSENFLSSIQICITLISIINGFYGGDNLAIYLQPLFEWMNLLPDTAHILANILGIVLITFFSIVWGELVPKTIALSNPEKAAVKVAPIIYIFSKLFFPIVKLLAFATRLTNKILGIKESEVHVTEEELRSLIKAASKEGVIEEEQNVFHENLFYFSDKKAKHIMTHRSEIAWIDINLDPDTFTRTLLQFKNSRILVCDKNLENYLGVLSVKEFLIKKMSGDPFDVRDLLDEPMVFPESVDAQDVLSELRKNQFYFCIIVDEFGTLEGIITLHDLLENIVGEIPEEEEIVEPDICVREDQSVLVNGDAPIETLVNVIDGLELDFEEMDYATVAGFVLEHMEGLPQVGANFQYLGYKIEIVDIDHNRIDKILISKIDTEQ